MSFPSSTKFLVNHEITALSRFDMHEVVVEFGEKSWSQQKKGKFSGAYQIGNRHTEGRFDVQDEVKQQDTRVFT